MTGQAFAHRALILAGMLILAGTLTLSGTLCATVTFAQAPVAPSPVPPPAVAALPVDPSPSAAKASPVQVSARLSNENPLFGDTIQLLVELRYPTGYRVFFPQKPNLRPFATDPNRPGKAERQEQAGQVIEKLAISLLVVRSGLLRTPKIEVPYHAVTANGGAGESGVVEVAPLRAVVRSQFAAATDVKPEPLPPPRPLVEDNTPLQIGLFVLGMMALAALLTLLGVRVYKARALARQPKPVVPPHVLALGRLETLLRSGRLVADEPRLVISELSEILREYLGGRYKFAGLDMTSTELLRALENVDLRGIALPDLRGFTETSDLVKFARMPATEDELRELHGFVRKVVERTMQSADEMERLRAAETARLARQRRLRIQVMAPAPLRLRAFGFDLLLGAAATALMAWLAVRTGNRGLFDASYGLVLVWLAVRDALGGNSPGKTLNGLQIAAFEDETTAAADPFRGQSEGPIASMAPWSARVQRNLLLLVPIGGLVAEALTCLVLPEQRRLGDQWAGTRVIDGRHGLRRGKPGWAPAVVLLVLAVTLLALPLWLGGRPS